MRLVPTRLTSKGKTKPLRRQRLKQRLGKGFCADYPGYCITFNTVVRFIGHTRRYLLTATDHARAQKWCHCHTYPRSPKMNAFNERFNRTVQEDFVDYEEGLLLEDLRLFNQHLLGYLDRCHGRDHTEESITSHPAKCSRNTCLV